MSFFFQGIAGDDGTPGTPGQPGVPGSRGVPGKDVRNTLIQIIASSKVPMPITSATTSKNLKTVLSMNGQF